MGTLGPEAPQLCGVCAGAWVPGGRGRVRQTCGGCVRLGSAGRMETSGPESRPERARGCGTGAGWRSARRSALDTSTPQNAQHSRGPRGLESSSVKPGARSGAQLVRVWIGWKRTLRVLKTETSGAAEPGAADIQEATSRRDWAGRACEQRRGERRRRQGTRRGLHTWPPPERQVEKSPKQGQPGASGLGPRQD